MSRFKLALLLIVASNTLCQDTVEKTPQEIIEAQKDGQAMLQDLIQGNRRLAIARLKYGADPNIKDEKNQIPLVTAVERGDIEFVQLLIEKGVDPNYHNTGSRAIYAAIRNNNVELVKLLFKHFTGFNNLSSLSKYLIDCVIHNNDTKLVNLFLDTNTFPSASKLLNKDENPDYNGGSCLTIAARENNIELGSLLLKHGINPNTADFEGSTAIEAAAKNNNLNFVELLLRYNADPNFWKSCPPLTHTYHNCDPKMAELLLKNGADIQTIYYEKYERYERDHFTYIYKKTDELLIECAAKSDNLTFVELLLRYNADPNFWKKISPLASAYNNNNLKMIELLLEKGANSKIYFIDTNESLIERAARTNNITFVKLLLKHKVDPNFWRTCPTLIYAYFSNNPEMAELLLENGADTQACSLNIDESLMETATRSNNLNFVKLLLRHNADPNYWKICPPLISAASMGYSEILTELLKHNADPTLTNNRGETARNVARRAGDHKRLYEATIRWKRTHQAASSSSSEDTKQIPYKEAVEQIEAPWKK